MERFLLAALRLVEMTVSRIYLFSNSFAFCSAVIFLAPVNEQTELALTTEQQWLHRRGKVWNEFHSLG